MNPRKTRIALFCDISTTSMLPRSGAYTSFQERIAAPERTETSSRPRASAEFLLPILTFDKPPALKIRDHGDKFAAAII